MLSSDDPVRVFQDFATLDLLSGGRAEIMAGRGSFIESFPLFGYDLDDYDELFAEKLELLLALRDAERVTWSGEHRAALDDLGVYPRPVQEPLPVWVAVGGTPSRRCAPGRSACRWRSRSSAGCPSGSRRSPSSTARRPGAAGHDPVPALSINSHGYIADTSQQALDESFPYAASMMNKIGRERGWPPMSRADYDAAATLRGANFVGSPQQVVEKILFQHEIFGHDRFLVQFSVGTLPHDEDACARSSCSAPRSRRPCAPSSPVAPRPPRRSAACSAAPAAPTTAQACAQLDGEGVNAAGQPT